MKRIEITENEVFNTPNDMDLGAYVRRKMAKNLSIADLIGLEITHFEPQAKNRFIFVSNKKRISISPSCSGGLWEIIGSEGVKLPGKITNVNYQISVSETHMTESDLELIIVTDSGTYTLSWRIANFENCALSVTEIF
jgi:hypothetical protein